MIPAVEELRPLSAGRLLNIRREVQTDGVEEWAVAAECNARVLAESCFSGGKCVFSDGQAVLESLTFCEMEHLLRRLAETERERNGRENPNFDPERFRKLKEA